MPEYKIFPLGDIAVTIDYGNLVNEELNKKIIRLFQEISAQPFDGMIEAIPAYSSLTVFYNFHQIRSKIPWQISVQGWVKEKFEELISEEFEQASLSTILHRIPVCYDPEFGNDLPYLSGQKNISVSDIIQIHCSKKYRVYMLGFLPGFAYMGEVDERIAVSRKLQPTSIIAGSVGIAGKQTGIYPLNSPGGWQILGRTPLKLFDPTKTEPCLLRAGDEVEFFSITKDEFENYQSRNS
jgi:inhibitor of KinA